MACCGWLFSSIFSFIGNSLKYEPVEAGRRGDLPDAAFVRMFLKEGTVRQVKWGALAAVLCGALYYRTTIQAASNLCQAVQTVVEDSSSSTSLTCDDDAISGVTLMWSTLSLPRLYAFLVMLLATTMVLQTLASCGTRACKRKAVQQVGETAEESGPVASPPHAPQAALVAAQLCLMLASVPFCVTPMLNAYATLVDLLEADDGWMASSSFQNLGLLLIPCARSTAPPMGVGCRGKLWFPAIGAASGSAASDEDATPKANGSQKDGFNISKASPPSHDACTACKHDGCKNCTMHTVPGCGLRPVACKCWSHPNTVLHVEGLHAIENRTLVPEGQVMVQLSVAPTKLSSVLLASVDSALVPGSVRYACDFCSCVCNVCGGNPAARNFHTKYSAAASRLASALVESRIVALTPAARVDMSWTPWIMYYVSLCYSLLAYLAILHVLTFSSVITFRPLLYISAAMLVMLTDALLVVC
jgi:hypothetical protein